MKITLDTNTGDVKVGGKLFDELEDYKKESAETDMRNFLKENTKLTDYEMDCMWMSYRYCIGRHTIASSMHAGHIWNNCKDRMPDERALFTAFDINREIENSLHFHKPYFHFPLTSLNRIYTSAVDIVCEFMEDYDVKSIDDFIKYRDIHIILTDNERGYKFEVVTWEEYLRPRILKIMQDFYHNDAMSEDYAWNHFQQWMNNEDDFGALGNKLEELTRDMPNKEHYYMHDFEDLFVWNDLVHCFDFEHHHESILTDGTHCKWFWTWTENTEPHDDGFYYKAFGYHRIRVPLDKWNGTIRTYIPDDSIQEDIY